VRLVTSLFCVALFGCGESESSREKAEKSLQEALQKERMRQLEEAEKKVDTDAKSTAFQNELQRMEFELRSAVNKIEADQSKKIPKPEIAE